MEKINKITTDQTRSKERKISFNRIIGDLKESVKIFYRKYLRSTTYYNHLEKKNTSSKNFEMKMMEFIRRQ